MSPSIGDSAHIRGTATYRSPIEDQAVAVYHAARRLAQANRFRPHVHNGPHGKVKGLAGPMVLSRLVHQLFPEYSDEQFRTAYSIINQALRKTDAMVCIRRPVGDPQHRDPKDMPVWFVADSMPDNLVVVTLAQAKKSADVTERPTHFDEKKFLTPRERRVSAEEAGETQPPGEVTVTHAEQKTPEQIRTEALAAQRDKVRQEHQRLVERILEEMQTSPVPMTNGELCQVINASEGWTFNLSTYRDAIRELTDDGKLVKRQETREEALVRGGGKMPKATRPQLYWPAPGPVPVRDRLPAGTEPATPAAQWAEDQKARNAEIDAQVYAAFRDPSRPRSRGRIADVAGLPQDVVNASLDRMVIDGRVTYRRAQAHYLPTVNIRHSAKTTDAETENPLPTETDPVTVPHAPSPSAPAKDGDEGDLQLVLSLAEKLGVQLPQGDEARVRDLENATESLSGVILDLRTENERLQKQVAALKAAIAALT